MNDEQLMRILEAALMVSADPLSIEGMERLFADHERPTRAQIKAALQHLEAQCAERGYELKAVGSGWRFQAKADLAPWIARLFEEKPPRYGRALLETLALIAYRQPITRAEIEEVRGVAVSTQIIRTLSDREWVRVIGHKELPGRPALYGTTRQFLDYFNLQSLDELPSLAELTDLDKLLSSEQQLELVEAEAETAAVGDQAESSALAGESEAEAEAEADDQGDTELRRDE
ncbi:condensin subunit ScpB [Ectothiorhodosinus mongolicus]|uniref:Condensin subunit ScpB n=1 Tax=Ectothiorhodosinus mongolicus TaxID=233100 RepID=A0A1R3W5H9_9GAMM|nr:SMC-Scp complex subunit ScpB [Ectothiorhodosinus mongolicus]ULX57619.1 SMC-Scp complex subunit ScpB [Ectothiorhodosinus mongolicus]SIT73132.1 condensin subunit ScpB [Ectothiorhodosinus mongolicus]